MKYFLLIITSLLCINSNAQTIDQASSLVTFEISNFGFKTVDGAISNIDGTVDFDTDNLDLCRFDVCIDASTIDTGNEARDEHLLKDDFFDVNKYPNICFYSEDVIKTAKGYAVTGNLSMKGIEKIVTIDFMYAKQTFKGTLEVDRGNFGIGPDGGFMVGKTVEISIVAKVF